MWEGSNRSHADQLRLCMICVRVPTHLLKIKPFLLKATAKLNALISFFCIVNWNSETCSMEGHYCQSDIIWQKHSSHLTWQIGKVSDVTIKERSIWQWHDERMNGSYAIWAWSWWKAKMAFFLSITTIVQNIKNTLNEDKAIVTVWLYSQLILMNSIVAHRLQCSCALLCRC